MANLVTYNALASSSNFSFLNNNFCSPCCPHDSCFWAVLRGFRQGVYYGAKIRFPHALVMTLLFRKGPWAVKARDIVRATRTHAWNLGRYVALFKAIECIIRHIRKKETGLNQFLAGFVAGGIMWGSPSAINQQINMYVMSRIIFGLAKMAVRHGYAKEHPVIYPLYAATIWAIVMYLFEHEAGTLQPSLQSSMKMLYHDSNHMPKNANNIIDWFLRDC